MVQTAAQPKTPPSERTNRSNAKSIYLATTAQALGIYIAIRAVLIVTEVGPLQVGRFVGTDTYMRLYRVMHRHETGEWFTPTYPRILPDGLSQHWTNPMDALLYVGAWVASPFVGFEAGLEAWGWVVAPILLIPSVALIIWAAAPIARPFSLLFIGLVFVTNLVTMVAFEFGRADHNGLLVLLYITYIGLGIRILLEPDRGRWSISAGVVASVAIWVSLESIQQVLIFLVVSAVLWVAGTAALGRALALHSTALFVTTAIWLPLEFGIGKLGSQVIDQITARHLIALAANAVFWWALYLIDRRDSRPISVITRAASVLGVAIPTIGLVVLLTPDLIQSPGVGVDPFYRATRMSKIAEAQPMLRQGQTTFETLVNSTSLFLSNFGATIPGLIVIVLKLRRCDDRGERAVWLWLAGLALVFSLLPLSNLRWTQYAVAPLAIPVGIALGTLMDRLTRHFEGHELKNSAARASTVTTALFWPFIALAALTMIDSNDDTALETEWCETDEGMWEQLATPAELGASPKLVAVWTDLGPEILFRTPHSVLSIPNHRFQPGYRLTHDIMTAQPSDAANLIREAGVEILIVCPSDAQTFGITDQPEALHSQLAAGQLSPYVEPVTWSTEEENPFLVFRVINP